MHFSTRFSIICNLKSIEILFSVLIILTISNFAEVKFKILYTSFT
jgi:hypothetical protein